MNWWKRLTRRPQNGTVEVTMDAIQQAEDLKCRMDDHMKARQQQVQEVRIEQERTRRRLRSIDENWKRGQRHE